MVALPLLAPSGPVNTAPVDVLIGAAIVSGAVWAWRRHHVWRLPYLVAAALYVTGGAVGALAGPVPGTGLIALLQDLVLLGWCWTTANICAGAARFRVVSAALVYGAVGWAAVLVVGLATGVKALSGETASEGSRTMLTFQNPNYAGNYFFLALMLVWATGRPRRRGVRLAASALLLVAMISTGSNSSLFSLATGVTVALVVALYRRRGAAAAIAALSCAALIAFAGSAAIDFSKLEQQARASDVNFLRNGIGRASSSVDERSTIFHESLQLYRQGNLLGAGPSSTKSRLAAEQAPYVKEAHDDYVATLLERGVIGGVGLVLLLAGIVERTARIVARPLRDGFASALPHPSAFAGALAGVLVGGAFNELLHTRQVWALFGLLAALSIGGAEARVRRQS